MPAYTKDKECLFELECSCFEFERDKKTSWGMGGEGTMRDVQNIILVLYCTVSLQYRANGGSRREASSHQTSDVRFVTRVYALGNQRRYAYKVQYFYLYLPLYSTVKGGRKGKKRGRRGKRELSLSGTSRVRVRRAPPPNWDVDRVIA